MTKLTKPLKILFTGGSSFSGYWFIQTLAAAGHQLSVILRKKKEAYSGTRLKRIQQLDSICTFIENTSTESEAFQRLIQQHRWDIVSHHAAEVTNYKSTYFNPIQALKNNTDGFIQALSSGNIDRFILSGSVFEMNEGCGSDCLSPIELKNSNLGIDVSPYGLSKSLTAHFFTYYCQLYKIPFFKFVIPNPFGPYEEAKYTAHLMTQWMQKKSVIIQTPDYVRDNIPIDLLALAYRDYITNPLHEKINPSGYTESQLLFTKRFANAIRSRLNLPCEYISVKQKDFSEPLVRINTDSQLLHPDWSESKFWDSVGNYYSALNFS